MKNLRVAAVQYEQSAADKPANLRKIRRFVSRLRLAPADARMLQGMLRQIRWKIGER